MSPPQTKSAEPHVAKAEKTTPGMRQWRAVKSRHPDHLLLFRMGDFYETFHEDAVTASEVLGITLTKRGVENGKPIPLVPAAGGKLHPHFANCPDAASFKRK